MRSNWNKAKYKSRWDDPVWIYNHETLIILGSCAVIVVAFFAVMTWVIS